MSMEWIRKNYGVPAKRGGRVEYTGEGRPELGTIRSARGSHLQIQLDGVKHTMPFHPTWRLRYLPHNTALSRVACSGDSETQSADSATSA